jgi:hypothetical protein
MESQTLEAKFFISKGFKVFEGQPQFLPNHRGNSEAQLL